MKVKIVFDISDEDRRNINNYWNGSGRSAKASHADVKSFIEGQISAELEAISMDDEQSDLDVEGEQKRMPDIPEYVLPLVLVTAASIYCLLCFLVRWRRTLCFIQCG